MEENDKARLGQATQHRLLSVAYWRFSVNMSLTVLDMTMLIVASATVLALHHETDIYSFRFGIPMDLSAYLLICAVLWAVCLHGVGVYHRHVMGDGYQLNALLIKGAVIAVMVTCAFDFIMRIGMSLTAIVLSFVFGLLLTMVERFFMRLLITQGASERTIFLFHCGCRVAGRHYARARVPRAEAAAELSAGGSMPDTA